MSRIEYVADVLVSAGPRTADKEVGLGEDVGGVSGVGDYLVFWICDGASGQGTFCGLSSRLWALEFGYRFSHACAEELAVGRTPDCIQTISSCAEVVCQRWNIVVRGRTVEEPFNIFFNLTFGGGWISRSTGQGALVLLGDCSALVIDADGLAQMMSPGLGVAAMCLNRNPDGSIRVAASLPNREDLRYLSLARPREVMVGSDGNGSLFRRIEELGTTASSADDIARFLTDFVPGRQDDKSIVHVRRLGGTRQDDTRAGE